MLSKTYKIANPQGFHIRPTKLFVEKATVLPCEVHLISKGRRVNGKSSLGMLTLGLKTHDEVTLEVDGEREAEALDELGEVLTRIYE
ncbi:HPr family phosphocarrier protein [Cohnella boryungensis]|jgi:phosphotransferase system HPr (HPr) family protein|uniref:HPr family phosphocarrier protein n=1 Tax=Cohnella boryungensis TaxID=768479 RepID=A0ABV8SLG4_9BACL